MNKIIENKEFTHTITKVKPKFFQINGGSYKDNDIDLSIKIKCIEKGFLMFTIKFTKNPHIYPFWVIINVTINDQAEQFFYEKLLNDPNPSKSYHTKFQKEILMGENVNINYKLCQVPPFVTTLINKHALCYLNSTIQLLVHLKKFRTFIFSISQRDASDYNPSRNYLVQMNQLFVQMMSGNAKTSSEELAKSFGWSPIAFRIQFDASEFLYSLLNNISQKIHSEINMNKFDSIFTSHFMVTKNPDWQPPNSDESNSKEEEKTHNETQIMLHIVKSVNKPVIDIIHEYLTGKKYIKKFTKFPEILLIQVKGQYLTYENKIDLSQFSIHDDQEDIPHSKYTLSGFIVHVGSLNNSGHYKCIVRSNYDNIWYYFNDSIHGVYSTLEYNSDIQVCLNSIAVKSKESEKIRVLMYIADDVMNQYFDPSETFIPKKIQFEVAKGNEQLKNFSFQIMTNDNIIRHIEEGHPDFKDIDYSYEFMLINRANKQYTKSDIYAKVAQKFNVDVNSFILRSADSNIPNLDILPNSDSPIANLKSNNIFYFEKIDPNKKSQNLSVPFFFLYYEFDPKKFLLNLENNLNHSHISKTEDIRDKIKSENVGRAHKIHRFLVKPIQLQNNEEEDDSDFNSIDKIIERNNFKYITTINLCPTDKLQSIKSQILDQLKKPETSTLNFYFASNTDNNSKVEIKEINSEDELKQYLTNYSSKFIYVQCLEDIESPGENNLISVNLNKIIDVKFRFFKYMEQALGKTIKPRLFPYAFLMENFSIPVTFCHIDDPTKSKTMLFPALCPFDLQQLNKIICCLMGEEYVEGVNFMQIFLSFRKNSPPFTEKIDNIDSLRRALKYALFNSEIAVYKVHFSLSQSSLENIHYDSDSDSDLKSSVYLYYKRFDSKKKDEISLRVYFSEDSINVKFMSQIIVKEGSKILNFAEDLRQIFPHVEFSEEDKQELQLIQDKKKEFTDVYRIIKIAKCKISNTIKPSYAPSSNLAIRFERIQNYSKDNQTCVGFIPCFYGARFNQTNLIAPFGSPFLFPVYQKHLKFKNYVKSVRRVKIKKAIFSMINDIKENEFELFVTNYDGIIQDIEAYDFESIMTDANVIENNGEFRTYMAICFTNMNAASFLDEKEYFNNSFKILY